MITGNRKLKDNNINDSVKFASYYWNVIYDVNVKSNENSNDDRHKIWMSFADLHS